MTGRTRKPKLSLPSNETRMPAIDRERLYEAWDVHPGIPSHERLEIILRRLVDALCDELEGKHGN